LLDGQALKIPPEHEWILSRAANLRKKYPGPLFV